jgi:hypothetical protein
MPGGRNQARPCPWLTCRHSLAAEGSTTESCVLDVVDRHPGGLTHDAVGGILSGLTRERIRQIESRALRQLERRHSGRSSYREHVE